MDFWLSEWLSIFVMLVSLTISAFFSGSETALFSLSNDDIEKLKKNNQSTKSLLKFFLKNPSGLLISILFGNLIVNIVFFCTSASISFRTSQLYSATISSFIGIITLIMIILFGEIIPKAIGMSFSRRVVILSSPFLNFWNILIYPLRKNIDILVSKITPNTNPNINLTEVEFKTLIDSTIQVDGFGIQEKDIVENILKLHEVRIREIMIPRVNQTFINKNSTPAEALNLIERNNIEQLPVYEDYEENIIGYVETDSLLFANKKDSISDLCIDLIFFPENKHLDEMLKECLKNDLKIVGIVDEYGGLSGTLALKDIFNYFLLESHSKETSSVELIGENEYRLKGNLNIREWRELFIGFVPNYNIRNMSLDTVSGLVISILKKMPNVGDTVFLGNLCFTIEEVRNNRIEFVKLQLLDIRKIKND